MTFASRACCQVGSECQIHSTSRIAVSGGRASARSPSSRGSTPRHSVGLGDGARLFRRLGTPDFRRVCLRPLARCRHGSDRKPAFAAQLSRRLRRAQRPGSDAAGIRHRDADCELRHRNTGAARVRSANRERRTQAWSGAARHHLPRQRTVFRRPHGGASPRRRHLCQLSILVELPDRLRRHGLRIARNRTQPAQAVGEIPGAQPGRGVRQMDVVRRGLRRGADDHRHRVRRCCSRRSGSSNGFRRSNSCSGCNGARRRPFARIRAAHRARSASCRWSPAPC